MFGWLYLIKNGDLYKIGITKNFEKRMRQLKPDSILIKLYSSDYMQLEREFHKKYKCVRIPQSEYFRLDNVQIREIKQRISMFYYPKGIILGIFINATFTFLLLLLFLYLLFSFFNDNIINVFFLSFLCLEIISYLISILSLLINTERYYNFYNELKFRLSKLFIYILYAFFFRFLYGFLD